MSELIILGYDDHDTAKRAYEQVQTLQRDYIVDLNGLALVTVDAEGKNHVETPSKIVGVSAASGALWGTLLGILFLVPVVGLLVGGALGACSAVSTSPASTTPSGNAFSRCSRRAKLPSS